VVGLVVVWAVWVVVVAEGVQKGMEGQVEVSLVVREVKAPWAG